jgi:hypothetical protein
MDHDVFGDLVEREPDHGEDQDKTHAASDRAVVTGGLNAGNDACR